MKIVFFGSSEFSVEPLKALKNGPHKLVGVVTVPPARKGRGQIVQETEVHRWSQEVGLPVWTPERLKDVDFCNQLKSLAADVFVVCSYGKILPQLVLDIPKLFSLNVHPSLLPLYRGAAPINWQLIRGEKFCGLTFFKMDAGMDSGDIVWQEEYPIGLDETSESLGTRLSGIAAEKLPALLENIEKGKVSFVSQDHTKMTLASKLTKADGKIDWSCSAEEIHNRVRGLLPWPCAYTSFRGETVRILKTVIAAQSALVGAGFPRPSKYSTGVEGEGTSPLQSRSVCDGSVQPGQILGVEKEGALSVATSNGQIFVLEIQREGRNPVSGREFANGVRLKPGECFS